MLFVEIEKNQQGLISQVTATGHSGYAEKGKDIVCAAVSILLQTCFVTLKTVSDISVTLEDNKVDFFQLRIFSLSEQQQKLEGIGDFLVSGLLLIEKNYSDYITVDLKKSKVKE